MDFGLKFLEDTSIREAKLIVVEVRHLLQSLVMTEDINSYQIGSYLRHMLRVHSWKIEIQRMVTKVEHQNKAKISKMTCGLDLTTKFLDEGFEDRVATLGPPS